MKNVIEFYTNPNGAKPVLDFLEALKTAGSNDPHLKQVFFLVTNGLQTLENYGVAHALANRITLSRDDGNPYTTLIAKDLVGFVPLLEFRINWEPSAVRIVFIEHQNQGVNYLVMIRAVIKGQTTDPAFKAIRNEAFNLISDFLKEPKKYISLSEGESEQK
ncbi:hypothetical protein L1N85_15095 [Paenibacillus alkaliterrae]|uniref:hypothetical protein n=1 Tax=Paenibacillus alkaliterrae TaxID=320909 RepID=UPI001F22BD71|nr:hypothetical protein [Paenibacillus alkaliterrae]MCF2939746.1 hypothetical protein [Paenibacillus alkaliterrae]